MLQRAAYLLLGEGGIRGRKTSGGYKFVTDVVDKGQAPSEGAPRSLFMAFPIRLPGEVPR